MTPTPAESPDLWPAPADVPLSAIADGYLSNEEAAELLGVTKNRLDGLVHERVNGARPGRRVSDLALELPEPVGLVQRTRVWRRSEIEAVKQAFAGRKTRRGPAPAAEPASE